MLRQERLYGHLVEAGLEVLKVKADYVSPAVLDCIDDEALADAKGCRLPGAEAPSYAPTLFPC